WNDEDALRFLPRPPTESFICKLRALQPAAAKPATYKKPLRTAAGSEESRIETPCVVTYSFTIVITWKKATFSFGEFPLTFTSNGAGKPFRLVYPRESFHPYFRNCATFSSTLMPIRRARLPPRIFFLAWVVSWG